MNSSATNSSPPPSSTLTSSPPPSWPSPSSSPSSSIISTCNATNLLDGLDGLCSGVTGVMSIGYLILALYLATQMINTEISPTLDPTRITLSLALLGAVMGFLPYNFNPASIFMGDTGSMFLGYICGAMMLLFAQKGTIRWFLSAIIIFGLPMMDTLLAIVRRKLNKKKIFSPDSNHFHHFLVKKGLSVRKAVLLSATPSLPRPPSGQLLPRSSLSSSQPGFSHRHLPRPLRLHHRLRLQNGHDLPTHPRPTVQHPPQHGRFTAKIATILSRNPTTNHQRPTPRPCRSPCRSRVRKRSCLSCTQPPILFTILHAYAISSGCATTICADFFIGCAENISFFFAFPKSHGNFNFGREKH